MRIYTRGGDDGSTGLFGGARVSKADPRVEAYGGIDELNAILGWVRSAGPSAEIDAVLKVIAFQDSLRFFQALDRLLPFTVPIQRDA